MPVQATAVTRLGVSGGLWSRLGGDYSNKAPTQPAFSGTIPDITGDEGADDIGTDLSTYFNGATSYSIAPTVEAGWSFDTVTGILLVDTDAAGTFGTYVVTGTNGAGSDASNAFSVIITATTTTTKGGYVPPTYIKTKIKKKDESVLEAVYELVALSEQPEAETPTVLQEQIKKVKVKAQKALNIKAIPRHNQEMEQALVQVRQLKKKLSKHIKEVKADEEAAIKALLEFF
jgi:hypothetical protein